MLFLKNAQRHFRERLRLLPAIANFLQDNSEVNAMLDFYFTSKPYDFSKTSVFAAGEAI